MFKELFKKLDSEQASNILFIYGLFMLWSVAIVSLVAYAILTGNGC